MPLSEWFLKKLGELGIKIAQDRIKKLVRDKSKTAGVDQFDGLQLNVSGKGNVVNVTYVGSVDALKKGKELVGKRDGEFIAIARADLAFFEGELLTPSEQWEEIFRQFKGYIADAHLAALRAAVTICHLEDRGFTAEAIKRKTEFNVHFRSDGRQIYNIVRSRIFHEWVLSAFVMRRFVEKDVAGSQLIFREFFEAIIQNLPWAIFVSKTMEADQLRAALDSRLSDEKVSTIAIFTRGPRLRSMAQRVLKGVERSLDEGGRKYQLETVDHKLGEGAACVFLLEVQPPTAMRRSRRDID